MPLQSVAPLEVENLYKEQLATRGRNGRLLSPKTVRGTHVVLREALADANVSGWWSVEEPLRSIQHLAAFGRRVARSGDL